LIQRLSATLAQFREQFHVGAWIYGLVAVVIIIALLLPPVSLLKRLGITGYTALNAQDSSISHADGLTLSVNPETYTDRLRAQIESVPRIDFLEGSAGRALREAVEVLPQNLLVKSPLYQIKTRGDSSEPVMIDVVVPNDAEPWETLDLYTWTGEEWKWVGSELHAEVAEHEFIRTFVTDIPEFIVVVQAESVAPIVSTSLEPGDNPVTAGGGVINEINPTGLLLGTDGGFVGDPNSLPQPTEGATYAILPTLRNWAPGATVNRGLLSDVLTIPEIQQAHIANIVQLCTERGFAGVDVDYRGVGPDERDAYGNFISALADALHAEGLRLSVVVEPPTPTNGSWDTGGYDWPKLGAVADAVKVPFPADPVAYIEGGQAQRLLDWATAQIDRYKLHMLVSSLNAEQSSAGVNYISLEQALAPFGKAVALTDATRVESGSQIEFGLSGHLLSITPQEAAGTYRLEYKAGDGEPRTIWLGTASNLALKLRWAQRYHLGGIVVTDILDPGNGPGIVDTVRTATAPPAEEIQVAWTVTSETAIIDQQMSSLTEPTYIWTVLASPGDYTVQATIAGFDHGFVSVSVGELEPEVTEVVTSTEEIVSADEPPSAADEVPTSEEATTEETGDCLDASYAADVTIPDNTQLDNDEEFEKTWRARNTGTCAWPAGTVIAFAGEAQMGAPDSVEVGAVEPDAEVEISVKMKAPTEAGRYTGVWQMKAADKFFGGQLTVVILAGDAPVAAVIAPVSGGSFELGGHIRDTGFPYADKMHYAGMTWAKVQVHYRQDA
ncbi:MAG: NBR1-Ig-like domain-containing protein, partial [Anaerolineae bacterium]